MTTIPDTFKGFRIIDWPESWDQSVYDQARADVLERYIDLAGVEAIIEFGSTNFPGVSDVDMYVLLEPGVRDYLFPGYWVFEGTTRRAMTHDLFLVKSELYRNSVHYFDPWIRAHNLLHGDPVRHALPPRPHEGREDRWMRLDHVHDSVYQMPYIVGCLKDRVLPVRHLLDMICYAAYCLREVRAAEGREVETDFGDRINDLRLTITREDPALTLPLVLDMTHECLRLFARAFMALGELVKQESLEQQVDVSREHKAWLEQERIDSMMVTPTAAMIYVDRDRSEEQWVKRWFEGAFAARIGWGPWSRMLGGWAIEMPGPLGRLFAGRLVDDGELTRSHREQFHAGPEFGVLKSEAVQARARVASENWTWLRSIRHAKCGGKLPHRDFGNPLDMTWRRQALLKSLSRSWPKYHPLNPS